MNCPDCKDALQDGATACACGWKAPYRQASRAPKRVIDPNSPETAEARQRVVELQKQCTFSSDTRSWVQKLKDRHDAGEILPYQQQQILKQRGLA